MSSLRVSLVCLAVLLLQLTLFSQARIASVAPELPALAAVLSGLLAGAERGSLVAFGVGLTWDLYLPTPLGLAAVSFTLVAYAVGVLTEDFFHDTMTQTATLVFVGTAAAVTVQALLGEVLGQRGLRGESVVRIVLVSSTLNSALALLLAPLMRWAFTGRLREVRLRLVPRSTQH